MKPTTTPIMHRLYRLAPVLVVVALSLTLLTYVGYGEALKTYPKFQHDRLAAQGEVIQNAIETLLRAGLPMRQFAGFETLSRPLIESDPSIDGIVVGDTAGNVVFAALRNDAMPPPRAAATPPPGRRYAVEDDGVSYKVVLPLRSKFETVGNLTLAMPKAVVTGAVAGAFKPLLGAVVAFTALFAAFALIAAGRRQERLRLKLEIAYGAVFLGMAMIVVAVIVALYSDGVQAKTKALANSLSHRLTTVFELGLGLDDFDGLDRTFADYRRLNPEIGEIALTIDNSVAIHTDPAAVGAPWHSKSANFEYVVGLDRAGAEGARVHVAVTIPVEVVVRQIGRSVKNFAVLFVASVFLSLLFLRMSTSPRSRDPEPAAAPAYDHGLELIKPVFFLAVFVEALNASFLPQLLQRIAGDAGLAEGATSMLFMVFFLCFALVLIPAGRWARSWGAKPLLLAGAVMAAAGLLLMASAGGLETVLVARMLAGLGQGLMFIGVQSHILHNAAAGQRTRGTGIIVFGFNGGMISGSAIGALLVVYLGTFGVFMAAGGIALGVALYVSMLITNSYDTAEPETAGEAPFLTQIARDMGILVRDPEFMKTVLLIGLPAKAVLTGVIIFALPLILHRLEFAQEDIGQIIMIYAGGVLLANHQVSRLVDRVGRTAPVLFWGSLVCGAGLVLIGLGDAGSSAGGIALPYVGGAWAGPHFATGLLLAGVAVLGLAHGFINAPVVTHVATTAGAKRIGNASATAAYRFLERIGHVAGPIVVGQLLILTNQDPWTIAYVGGGFALLGLLFLVPTARRPRAGHEIRREGAT